MQTWPDDCRLLKGTQSTNAKGALRNEVSTLYAIRVIQHMLTQISLNRQDIGPNSRSSLLI